MLTAAAATVTEHRLHNIIKLDLTVSNDEKLCLRWRGGDFPLQKHTAYVSAVTS